MSRVNRSETGRLEPEPLLPAGDDPKNERLPPKPDDGIDFGSKDGGFDQFDARSFSRLDPPGLLSGDEPGLDTGLSLLDQDLELSAIFARTSSPLDPGRSKAAAGTPTPAEIARARGEIDTESGHTREVATQHGAEALNRLLPANTGPKTASFKALLDADKDLKKAVQHEDTARAALAVAAHDHDVNPSPKTERALHAAEAKLERAQTARKEAEAVLASADADVRKAVRAGLGKSAAAHETEIANLDLSRRDVTRDKFDVKVGNARIELKNAVDTYATSNAAGLTGSAVGDGPAAVQGTIDRTSYSPSVKNVFKGVSANEGTFSSINGYDSKGITFGFIQMAGAGPKETLSELLAQFKKQHPADFGETLQKYGIDIERGPRGNELVVHQPDGSTLRGTEAGRKVGTDPHLAAILSASGTNPAMQETQLAFAKDYLDDQRNHSITAGGEHVKISDLITSERGNGLLFDRSVHEGRGGARSVLTAVAEEYMSKHPTAKLSDEKVRAEIEQAYVTAVSHQKGMPARGANIAATTSSERGSYVE